MLTLALLSAAIAATAEPVTEAEFAKLFREIVPRSEAPWQTIPWETDLLEARALAVKTRRPLFMWSMNGHPLGGV